MINWKHQRRVFAYGLVQTLEGLLKIITLGFYNPAFTWKFTVYLAKKDARKAQENA